MELWMNVRCLLLIPMSVRVRCLCCVEAGVNAARDSAKPRMLREYHILL